MTLHHFNPVISGLAALLLLMVTGCGRPAGDERTPDGASEQVSEPSHEGHDHSGWWCVEHAIPEAECALCDTRLAAKYREKGDWCEEHLRPDSQCFVCRPELADKYAALYEAKYGKGPPQPTE